MWEFLDAALEDGCNAAFFKIESLGWKKRSGYSQRSNRDDTIIPENKQSGSARLKTVQARTAAYDPEHTPQAF